MLFPTWHHILSPSDLKDHWHDRTPTVYCACLRGRKVPRLCGTDDMGILYIGYCVHRKRTFREFVRCSTNGTKGHKAALTLHYFRKVSRGVDDLFGGGPTGPHLEFYYIDGDEGLLLSSVVEYIRAFGELPPVSGVVDPLKAPGLKTSSKAEWTYFKDPSELPTGKHPAVYRVHLERSYLSRWLGKDTESIIEVGQGVNPRERLDDFVKSATTGKRGHSEGQKVFIYSRISPAFKALLGNGIPGCFRYSIRYVDEKDLLPEENVSTDEYTSPYGELPPMQENITGGRKWLEELLRKSIGRQ